MAYRKQPMDQKRALLLSVIGAAEGGQIEGRTRLQKLVFLAQEEGDINLSDRYEFEPYDYGPFEAQILHDIDAFENAELVKERQHRIPNGKKYIIQLTEEGEECLQELENGQVECVDFEEIQETANTIVERFDEMPISRLLEYVYNNYEEYTENSVL